NAGAEYGNYSGGQVNVATKSGTNQFHGDAFDFLRNSDMDARNFYSPDRGVLRQNMFGGTFGGPIIHNKIFFFGDYQGTRQETGVDTGNIAVPSAAERAGDFSDEANLLTGTVNGTFFANTLAGRLRYPVAAGEPYYTAGCTSSAACVFPNAVIPQSAWSPVSAKAIPLIPLPNVGPYFSTAANSATLRDDKGGIKVDGNSRLGMLSAYYLFDPWTQMNPYNPGYGGSTVPGFPSETVGKAQLLVLNATTSFGSNNVNQFTFSYMRNKNVQGLSANNGAGPTLASLGFAPPDQSGLFQVSPAYANWPELSFDNYTLGAFNSVVSQFNNTYQWQDDFTKITGTHTLKFGADYHLDQVDISHPNNGGNGGFGFGSPGETGIDFANMLIGAPGDFFQGAPAALDLRSYYIGLYAEDSWRATPNLTFNYGVRWEATPYWWDSKNRNPATLPGIQSRVFPGAPEGYVFPGDPGVPKTLAYPRYNNFGPRLGLAYAPNVSGGLLHWMLGDAGKSSIRAGYGLYYTNVQGSATFNFAAPPYGLFYSSPAPPLFDQPFVTRASGQNLGQRFPVPTLDPNNINWAQFEPISGNRNPLPESKSPYGEHVDFSIQRQFSANTLLSLSYVGSFGHHLLVNVDSNPGNPALCLSVSQLSQVMPGTPTCGPFGENGVYYPITGGVINGTRGPFGPEFGGNGYFLDRGNSSYNALQVALRRTAGRAQFLLSYTYSKAMDDGSGFGDQVLPTNYSLFRALSVYDLTHNFSFSYSYELPFDKLFRRDNRLTRGWRLAGITTFATGTPVQIAEVDDQSLLGSTGNSPFYGSTDEPNYTPGAILVDTNPRNGRPYFNTSLFSMEPLGGQGTSSKRFFHGPGINNWNLALLKDVRLTESKTLQFRGEFFNAFNHANFGQPDGYFHDSQFGLVGNAGSGRVGQVAMKFIF
ncbi:MAG TPA: TonB-dependent receptor, partial [Terriglobia bacterium]|nr:TonB-dependent receptor [Terriglobia bacterium]